MDTPYEIKVRIILESILDLQERQYYGGDYDAVIELLDLETAIKLAGLTEQQTEYLFLLYVVGMGQQEIAETWNTSQQNVSSRHRSAIKKLAKVYEEWGEA